ncbi:MAG TPA: hypothetical protein VK506_12295 [Conexibacter sp.]|nr:hypothetical protein [Conexibacter sp.]
MVRHPRLLAALGAALCALAVAASPAAATRAIRIPGGPIQKVVEGFTIRAFGGEVRIICRLTLNGRLASVISKANAGRLPEGRMGRIEEGATEGCVTNFGGFAAVTILVDQETPISLRYQAFLGMLPAITGIRFRKLGFAFQVVEPVIIGACLYRGIVDLLLTIPPVEDGGGRIFNPEAFITPNAIAKTGGALCPEIVEVSGAGRVTPPQGAILID